MSKEIKDIPQDFKIWYIAESRKQPQSETFKEWKRRGQQLCYEVAHTEGYQEAAEAAYRHLSSSEPAKESQPDAFLEWLDEDIEAKTIWMVEIGENDLDYASLEDQLKSLTECREKYLSLHAQPNPEPSDDRKETISKLEQIFKDKAEFLDDWIDHAALAYDFFHGLVSSPPSVKPERGDSDWAEASTPPDKDGFYNVITEANCLIIDTYEQGKWSYDLETDEMGTPDRVIRYRPSTWMPLQEPDPQPSPAVQQEDGEVPEDATMHTIRAWLYENMERPEGIADNYETGFMRAAAKIVNMYGKALEQSQRFDLQMKELKMQLSAREKETKNAIRWVLENTHGRTVADLEDTYSQYLQSLQPTTNE